MHAERFSLSYVQGLLDDLKKQPELVEEIGWDPDVTTLDFSPTPQRDQDKSSTKKHGPMSTAEFNSNQHAKPWADDGCCSVKLPWEGSHTQKEMRAAWANATPQREPAGKQLGLQTEYQYLYLKDFLKSKGNLSPRPVSTTPNFICKGLFLLYFHHDSKTIFLPIYLQVPGDGNCLFYSIRAQLHKCPQEFSNQMLRRMVVQYLAVNWQWAYPIVKRFICKLYGNSELGPFSYISYLEALLDPGFYGDLIVLYTISWMWGGRITVLMLPTCSESRIRHNQEIQNVEIVLLLCGEHYSSVCKYQ